MKKFLTSRGGAWVVAIVLILLSVYFGAYRSLSVAVREVADGFSEGVTYTDDSGDTYLHASIRSQLINRVEASTSLVSLARNFGEVADETAALRNASNTLKDLIYGTGTPAELCAVNKELTGAFNALHSAVSRMELDFRDTTQLDELKTIMSGSADEITNSGYNESVRAFNRETLSVFPTNLLQAICFVDAPELFE